MARCSLMRVVVPCHRDRGVDWLFGALVDVLCWNHPIDHLDRHCGLGDRVLGRSWRGVARLRLCGRVRGLEPLGLAGAMVEMVVLFLCSRLGGRWRCASSLRCRGRHPRRLG